MLALTSPGSRAHSLDLIGGMLALNFVNTSSGRGGPEHLEHLRGRGDVLAWAHHAGVLTDSGLKRAATGDDCLLAAAQALRETIYRIGLAYAENRAPPSDALRDLRAIHADTLSTARLTARPEGGFAWHWESTDGVVNAVLGPIALSAVSLLLAMDLSRVKQCGGQHCGWLFFDQTKNRRRRWCEMSVCGNRAKQRKHRQRHRQGDRP